MVVCKPGKCRSTEVEDTAFFTAYVCDFCNQFSFVVKPCAEGGCNVSKT